MYKRQSIPYFFRIGKRRFITDHKINKFMGKLYFAAVLCDNHCIIPSVGSLFRCKVCLLYTSIDKFFEIFLSDFHNYVRIHLDESSVAVPCPALVA